MISLLKTSGSLGFVKKKRVVKQRPNNVLDFYDFPPFVVHDDKSHKTEVFD